MELTKENLLRVLEGLCISERVRPDADGMINPVAERCGAVEEACAVIDSVFGVTWADGGTEPADAYVVSSVSVSEANQALIKRMRDGT